MHTEEVSPSLENYVQQIEKLGEALVKVGILQPMYASIATEEMKARGEIIRKILPTLLMTALEEDSIKRPASIDDLNVEGKDGVGRKAEIPWVRLYSKSLSPSATTGWYIVYLFDAKGRYVYLSLNQGSTTLVKDSFVTRPEAEIKARVNWARKALKGNGALTDSYLESINLRAERTHLGPAYEVSNIYSMIYDLYAMPSEDSLKKDLSIFLDFLSILYEKENQDFNVPGNTAIEIQELIEISNVIAGKSRNARKGQGFKLSKQERDAIEKHAMEQAKKYYENLGWLLKDCSKNKPYDYLCKKNEKELYLEVKGTTSEGKSIILTRGEVKFMTSQFPNTALFILSGIKLNKGETPIKASGGKPYVVSPWCIDENKLEAISYQFFLTP